MPPILVINITLFLLEAYKRPDKTVGEVIAQKEKLSNLLPLALKEKVSFKKKILKIYCPHTLDCS